MAITIHPITRLTDDSIQPLIEASKSEGYTFVQSLWDDYQSGVNRFNGYGAVLLGAYQDEQTVAVGGIHVDPYAGLTTIGRIRHVYVLPAYRRRGIGQALVHALIAHASGHFTIITLRTLTDHGRAFYTALGFSVEPRFADSTHWLEIVPE